MPKIRPAEIVATEVLAAGVLRHPLLPSRGSRPSRRADEYTWGKGCQGPDDGWENHPPERGQRPVRQMALRRTSLNGILTDRNRHFSGCALSGKEKPGFLVLRRRSGSTARPVTIRKYVAPTEEAGFVPGDHR
jgi:hypothetical protein